MITLDSPTEQRIQRQIDLGHGADANEIINRALSYLEPEEEWLHEHKDALNGKLRESMAQAERGQVVADVDLMAFLAEKRSAR